MSDNQLIELSSVVKKCLLSFTDPKAPVSLEAVDVLVRVICESLVKAPVGNHLNDAIKALKENKNLEKHGSQRILELYTSLSSLILQAASENVSPSQTETTLKAHNWSVEQISRFLKIFLPQQSKIRAILKLYQTKPPRLVDVNWRLDFQIETNTRGAVKELVYIIDLIMEDDGVLDSLTFTTSLAELEDIVNILKDACQSLKRVALS